MDLSSPAKANDDRRWDMDGVIPLPQRVPAGGARPPCSRVHFFAPDHTAGLRRMGKLPA